MDNREFRKYAHSFVDWMADYLAEVEKYPVKSQVEPGQTLAQLPPSPPLDAEPMDRIMADFNNIVMPGITHWQHPSFMAYFNANNSYPSVLAEMLTATLGAQCMSWQTSPAATELEERVMQWLGQMIGLPEEFVGVIQDTASTATLCALLSAREKASGYEVNRRGFSGAERFTVYCSSEAHSSIEKAVKIAGLGRENLRKIDVDAEFAMIPGALQKTLRQDLDRDAVPLAVVAATGTTGSVALDPLAAIGKICSEFDVWLHVDAAYAGTALLLPEMRRLIDGIEFADSFVFNPHKWMFTNFDCSAYFVKDPGTLVRTFEILPEYLKTAEGKRVNNYRDWGIQLGRRFRALKLWFVIRSFGVSGLQARVRDHIRWCGNLAKKIDAEPDFELLAPAHLATVCFRFKPLQVTDEEELDRKNGRLLEQLNDSGKIFLSHTRLNGVYTIRLVVGQTQQSEDHVNAAWDLIRETAKKL